MRRSVCAGLFLALCLSAVGAAHAQRRVATPEERRARYLAGHPEADANGDGTLTVEEIEAYRAIPDPAFANVHYGPHARNVLDLWQAPGDGSHPLVIEIHGGGFMRGDKGGIEPGYLKDLLKAGISVAAINYRYVSTDPFPAPMEDAVRAMQFLRNKAGAWNLDPARFAASGGSAGAVMALWLGLHDDFADPSSEDPVAKESTRLACVVARAAPTTFDRDTIIEMIGGEPERHASAFPFFGVKSLDEGDKPEVKKLIREASPVTHVSADDPPVFLEYGRPDAPLSADWNPAELVHHPRFGVYLKEALDKVGVEAVLRYPEHKEDEYEDAVDFLAKKLRGNERARKAGE